VTGVVHLHGAARLSNMRSILRGMREILADSPAVAVLRIVATGQVANSRQLDIELHRLEADGLLQSLPGRRVSLTVRGRMLLEVANGESACPLDEP
jgi:hypothetical protein